MYVLTLTFQKPYLFVIILLFKVSKHHVVRPSGHNFCFENIFEITENIFEITLN